MKWPKIRNWVQFFGCIWISFFCISCNQESGQENIPDNAFDHPIKGSSSNGDLDTRLNSVIELNDIPQQQSNISFNNQLNDSIGLNPFVWNFIYTGGGVATGDLNNDGLPDIYFAGNQVGDEVYQNTGEFKFINRTAQSGIEDNLWSTGVFMADVNNDGLLDIYVCKSSYTVDPEKNRNKLLINQGNFKFENQAEKYGVDDSGYSTHASFFDLDQDGDLDLYVVNQPIDVFAKYLYPNDQVQNYPTTDQVYLNQGDIFKKAENGFRVSTQRHGLGISISDFDWNGFTDVYIGSDYHHADQLWSNNGQAFTNTLEKNIGHQSFYSMGSDVSDVNNDGWVDLIVLDMAFEDHRRAKTNMASMSEERFWQIVNEGGHYQYSMNTLQVNKGNGTFSEIAQLAGVAKSDWSWAPLFVDLDLDGFQDLLITNGIFKDMQNNDFNAYVAQTFGGQVGPQNFKEVMKHLPSNPIGNKIYKNKGNLLFDDISLNSQFSTPGFSHGLAYADFDLDGRVDLVVNNMNKRAEVFQNNSKNCGHYLSVSLTGSEKNVNGLGASVVVYSSIGIQAATMQTTRGYYSSSEPILHFGLGNAQNVDSIKVCWNSKEMSMITQVNVDQNLNINYNKSKKEHPRFPKQNGKLMKSTNAAAFVHQEKNFDDFEAQVLLPYKLSQNGPFLATGDLNGDSLIDLFVGGAAGQTGAIFLQNVKGGFIQTIQSGLSQDADFEDMEAIFLDVDLDQDLDLFVVSGSNEIAEQDPLLVDRLYLNDGQGNFLRTKGGFPSDRINGQAVEKFDLDQDGDLDIIVGGRLVSGQYPLPPSSAIYENRNGEYTNVTALSAPWLKKFQLITDIKVCDVNNDGKDDLMFVGEWMKPTLALNMGSQLKQKVLDNIPSGIWWAVESGDFDQDGDQDFLLGNLGKNNKYQLGEKGKIKIFAGDLDANGDHDLMMATLKKDKFLPIRGRECSSQEVPYIQEKFPTFEAFSEADINDLLPLNRKIIYEREIQSLGHIYLENKGNLNFESHPLPQSLQTGVIKDFEIADLNQDGHLDFAFVGNHFPTEVETPRFDGLLHGVCLNDGKGNFRTETFLFQGLGTALDLRAIRYIPQSNHQSTWIIAQNNGPLLTLQEEATN